MSSLGHHQILAIRLVAGQLLILGLNYSNSTVSETDFRGPETDSGSIETDLRVYRTHDTLEPWITDDPSQPGGLCTAHDELRCNNSKHFFWECVEAHVPTT